MKELNQHDKILLPTSEIQQQIKKLQFLGKIKLHKGHLFYELDLKTGIITLAEIEIISCIDNSIKRKCIIKPNCMYETALNMQNAIRRFNKKINKLRCAS